MSDLENEKQPSIPENQTRETAAGAPVAQSAPSTEETPKPVCPEPAAIGDERVSILKHGLVKKALPGEGEQAGIEIKVQNNSDKIIGTAAFEAVFYDGEGNQIGTAKHDIIELAPGPRRVPVFIPSPSDKAASYAVKVVRTTIPPTPNVTGNDKIKIINHSLLEMQLQVDAWMVGMEFSMQNISDTTIATVVFEAEFFDKDGNIFDKMQHKEIEFYPGQARGVRITSSIRDYNKIKSYDVKIAKLLTADFEKVQIRRRDVKVTSEGNLDIKGAVKNISGAKTDAAVVVNIFNTKNEDIGCRVILLKDIEHKALRDFQLTFTPPPGEIVDTCILKAVSEIVTS